MNETTPPEPIIEAPRFVRVLQGATDETGNAVITFLGEDEKTYQIILAPEAAVHTAVTAISSAKKMGPGARTVFLPALDDISFQTSVTGDGTKALGIVFKSGNMLVLKLEPDNLPALRQVIAELEIIPQPSGKPN